ncbi:E3 ubiquitin-protein ligase TRIM62 isoform X2 [Epinephelus fuscoguttatus]|uniref:E3 ubiquitin-protein ligase TRIM62 isoform X2 n=1 Tax=Epinephelus fuscoguttatus TaxID=293821 RepID=UPI0020D086BF|nr:E3 ubiquitin-protein ligase TRIM62 isoform X2 [Epinephelus fuscoguttatus]XP_049424830.1 E3 ubiquitin-protein ligase TRIM62 isoform X2 [Epinephelus fuscoguttatus]
MRPCPGQGFCKKLGMDSDQSSEMAEKKASSVGNGQSTVAQSGQSSLPAPSAGTHSVLQDGLSFTPLDSNDARAVQPFPRSPKLQKKIAKAGQPSQEQLSRRMEELQAERSKTEAHIQSLKKRRADLSRSTELMKQQVREHFQNMRCVLKQDEQAVQDSLELDLRQTRTKLDYVLKNWEQHQDQVTKGIKSIQRALSNSPTAEEDGKGQSENLSPKKPDASEMEIRLSEERFERLLKTLSSISKQLKAQLQRKTLLLDSSPMVIDRQTCHSLVTVTSEGRCMYFSDCARSAPEHPLQFDKVCCALGSSPVTNGQSYWEVDVRCCSAWAVGATYASLERKGRDKGTKLGRNRNSWCVELRNNHLSAWHNDRHVPCQGVGQMPLEKVGVWVNYDKGQLMFYDADTMVVLQRFSAAVMPVFDRAHHQFTEPLYPAIRFLRPPENQLWPNHVELCHLHTP